MVVPNSLAIIRRVSSVAPAFQGHKVSVTFYPILHCWNLTDPRLAGGLVLVGAGIYAFTHRRCGKRLGASDRNPAVIHFRRTTFQAIKRDVRESATPPSMNMMTIMSHAGRCA